MKSVDIPTPFRIRFRFDAESAGRSSRNAATSLIPRHQSFFSDRRPAFGTRDRLGKHIVGPSRLSACDRIQQPAQREFRFFRAGLTAQYFSADREGSRLADGVKRGHIKGVCVNRNHTLAMVFLPGKLGSAPYFPNLSVSMACTRHIGTRVRANRRWILGVGDICVASRRRRMSVDFRLAPRPPLRDSGAGSDRG